jgi:hypothetical protein
MGFNRRKTEAERKAKIRNCSPGCAGRLLSESCAEAAQSLAGVSPSTLDGFRRGHHARSRASRNGKFQTRDGVRFREAAIEFLTDTPLARPFPSYVRTRFFGYPSVIAVVLELGDHIVGHGER